MRSVAAIILGIFCLATTAGASEISSYAIVQHDGTLHVDGRTIRLFGIYIPPTADSCRFNERPVVCSSRAALALQFKISGFVHCQPIERNDDGSITARCRADGDDLSAYLLERGWALALPDAPFEYVALERIAQQHNLGVWGLAVERIPPRRR